MARGRIRARRKLKLGDDEQITRILGIYVDPSLDPKWRRAFNRFGISQTWLTTSSPAGLIYTLPSEVEELTKLGFQVVERLRGEFNDCVMMYRKAGSATPEQASTAVADIVLDAESGVFGSRYAAVPPAAVSGSGAGGTSTSAPAGSAPQASSVGDNADNSDPPRRPPRRSPRRTRAPSSTNPPASPSDGNTASTTGNVGSNTNRGMAPSMRGRSSSAVTVAGSRRAVHTRTASDNTAPPPTASSSTSVQPRPQSATEVFSRLLDPTINALRNGTLLNDQAQNEVLQDLFQDYLGHGVTRNRRRSRNSSSSSGTALDIPFAVLGPSNNNNNNNNRQRRRQGSEHRAESVLQDFTQRLRHMDRNEVLAAGAEAALRTLLGRVGGNGSVENQDSTNAAGDQDAGDAGDAGGESGRGKTERRVSSAEEAKGEEKGDGTGKE
ncbi:hypothetical protein VTJ04DRAFT_3908 [Mycothermus thermophilus]|uniref:uncharacterized protein n=1 Tax=Humicola insolens TaxID=85995 RepID=UPI003742F2DA